VLRVAGNIDTHYGRHIKGEGQCKDYTLYIDVTQLNIQTLKTNARVTLLKFQRKSNYVQLGIDDTHSQIYVRIQDSPI